MASSQALPKPHGEKLRALVQNEKLPDGDRKRVQGAVERYENWLKSLEQVAGSPDEVITQMIALLEEYKRFIDIELIFDSEDDFLYRQKGQLKLDNSIVEEFLPYLVQKSLSDTLPKDVELGARQCFSAVYFSSDLRNSIPGGGLQLRTKDQDFTLSRRLYLRSSHQSNFQDSADSQTSIAYVAAEIKTNLDKTMFQEAAATAHDVKVAVAGARYYLLCEWLDMTPISTATTDIDEVLILRRARRVGADVRSKFSSLLGRRKLRDSYLAYLKAHPFQEQVFARLLHHIRQLLGEQETPKEGGVLERGYF